MDCPNLKLRDGNAVPMLAFGTGTAWFKNDDDRGTFNSELVQMTKQALDAGFRHIDCAEMYNNEEEVGIALRESKIPRNELYITTKVANGIKDILRAIDESLRKLQLDFVDLYLIHEPWNLHTAADSQQAWQAMEEVKASGKARSIGVSNFTRKDMEMIMAGKPSELPAVIQLEYHPYLQRENQGESYLEWMQLRDIQVAAFKGLSPVARCPDGPLAEPLKHIAKSYETTESAVNLRWLLQQNIVAITTTSNKSRLQEYAAALTFELTEAEMQEIATVGKTFWKRFAFKAKFADDDRS